VPRFHARHTTEIRYSRAISQSVNEVRLTRHIRLAVGRDYDDVPPLRGRFRGRTAQELRVSVELRAIDGGERM
jgi:transglutaminase-like putative cysteine protease